MLSFLGSRCPGPREVVNWVSFLLIFTYRWKQGKFCIRVALRETEKENTTTEETVDCSCILGGGGWRVPKELVSVSGLGTTSYSKITVGPKSLCMSVDTYCIRN